MSASAVLPQAPRVSTRFYRLHLFSLSSTVRLVNVSLMSVARTITKTDETCLLAVWVHILFASCNAAVEYGAYPTP